MNAAIKFGAPLLMALGLVSAPAMARDGWHGGSHGHGHSSAPARNGNAWQGRSAAAPQSWQGNRGYRSAPVYQGDRGYRYSQPSYRSSYAPAYRSGYRGYRYSAPRYVVRGGYYPAPRPLWVRGNRYYGGGYGPTYVVNDWGGYGLGAPPYGYYWRRDDLGNFLLVAAATGIITDLILNH